MRFAIWIVTAVLLLPWTLAAWATAWLLRWSVNLTAAGQVVDAAEVVGRIQLPAWLDWWVDPGWILATLDMLAHALQALQAALPWLQSAAGWLVALLWIIWGLGTLLVILVAATASWVVGRTANGAAAAR